ncbi:MAG: YitT family protein [Lachnospiraceae bacterium]
MRKAIQKETSNMFWAIFGVVCFASAYRLFIFPAGLYSGGFTGIAQLLKLFITEIMGIAEPAGIDMTGVIFWCINIPLFLLGYRSIGKRFLIRTVIAVFIQSVLMAVIPAPGEPLLDDMLLNCIIGGVLSGFGVGITLRAGGSGGGTDIVGMYCAKRYPGFGVGKLSVMINLCIYLIAAMRYDLEVAAYSMVFSIASGIMVDRVHYQNIQVSAFIVTKNKTLGEKINQVLYRGVTSWNGWGEYSHQEEIIHMVVVNKYELQALKRLLRKEDPDAFVQVFSPDLVMGNFEKRLEV